MQVLHFLILTHLVLFNWKKKNNPFSSIILANFFWLDKYIVSCLYEIDSI